MYDNYNISIKELSFEWNIKKNEINKRKHGIAFEEALTVFLDENAILFDDPEHSVLEERFLIIGISEGNRLCIVSHCYRNQTGIIRIISARRASRNESQAYYRQEG